MTGGRAITGVSPSRRMNAYPVPSRRAGRRLIIASVITGCRDSWSWPRSAAAMVSDSVEPSSSVSGSLMPGRNTLTLLPPVARRPGLGRWSSRRRRACRRRPWLKARRIAGAERLKVCPRRDLGDDAAEPSVFVDARGDLVGQQRHRAVATESGDADSCFVAGAFDGQDDCRHGFASRRMV